MKLNGVQRDRPERVFKSAGVCPMEKNFSKDCFEKDCRETGRGEEGGVAMVDQKGGIIWAR